MYTGNSQSSYEGYKRMLKYTTSETAIENRIDSIIIHEISNDSILLAIKIIHDYSLKLYRRKKYREGLKYVTWEQNLYEKHDIFNEKYISVLFNGGLFSFKNFEYRKAESFYNKVIEKDTFDFRLGNSYFQLGRVYYNLGNYQEALNYYLKRIRYLEGKGNYNSLVSAYINMSSCYARIGTLEASKKSLKALSKADSISKEVEISTGRYIDLQNSLGELFSSKYNYDFNKAKFYRKNNLTLGLKFKDSSIIARAYNNLAFLHNIAKKDSVDYFVSQGLKYVLDYKEAEARLHDNLTDYYIRSGDFWEALYSIHNSLEIILESKLVRAPTMKQIQKSILKEYTLYCLKKKAEIYLRLYLKEQEKNHLENAIKNIEAAEYVIGLLINGTTEQSTQLIWRREASQAYLYGAYASHLLGDSEKAFSFMEKNKALLLSEGILKNTEFANLPKHISDEETKLKKQIYELENELSKNEDNSILQDSLFNAKQYHEKYVDSLKTVYPKYFARKVDVAQVPLEEVKKEIKNNQAIVSYIWNEFDSDKELIIGFITTKDTSTTFEVENVEELKEQIKKYQKLVSKPFSTKEEQENYKEIAFKLYQSLFPNQETQDLIKGKNLLIIPDGNLQNIPFESLITQENSNEYLILNGDVNYSYSYSFLKHNEKVQRKTTEDFIGYSPVSFQTDSLSNLNNSKEELQAINAELNGVSKLQDTATKEDFLNNSKNSKIIHLATHADAGENPWIAFADKKLELHELYTYKNNADLVTLSACNTSLGEVAKGEGVLSLARGFFYSGSKSVVSSLWEVNDKSTSEIMTGFYKNLKEGQTKSEAINNAKRDYLQTHSLSEQSPYYWSSFILIGDAGSIDISNNYYVYFLAAVLIFMGLIFFRKKIKIFG